MYIVLWAFFTFQGVVNLPYPVKVFYQYQLEDCNREKEALRYQYRKLDPSLNPETKVELSCEYFAQF